MILILSHREAGVVCLNALQLILKDVTTVVTSNDATCLPEANLVEKFMPADSYFTNEQLIDVVGG